MMDFSDRKNCFYWQTDRDLPADDYARIFLRRQEIDDAELITVLRNGITTLGEINQIKLIPPSAGVLKGNVNIVRQVIINQQQYVVRFHPKGIKNGYFFVEGEAWKQAEIMGLPVPKLIEIHTAKNDQDMDFILSSACEGENMDIFLTSNRELEKELLFDAGIKLAKIHKIEVKNYGSFDNEVAKTQKKLVGLHKSYHDFIHCGLSENLQRLIKFDIISQDTSEKMANLFQSQNYEPDPPVMVHNDYADWNLLTDGRQITGILDWDECHAGDAVAELACWSTFFDIERMEPLLKGYKTVATLPKDYEAKFHFYRLRYTISKMALRIKRFQVDKSDFIKDKLDVGKRALSEELKYFIN